MTTKKLNSTKIIHVALCLGVALIYFVLGDLHTLEFLTVPNIDAFTLMYLTGGVSAIFLSNMVYKQQLKNVNPKLTLEQRVGNYQTASIIRWAILEGAAFLILFLKKELLIIGLFLILFMVFSKPSFEGMKRDYAAVGK
ncbi:MAG: MFS transporter [Bacteroidota bacterium]